MKKNKVNKQVVLDLEIEREKEAFDFLESLPHGVMKRLLIEYSLMLKDVDRLALKKALVDRKLKKFIYESLFGGEKNDVLVVEQSVAKNNINQESGSRKSDIVTKKKKNPFLGLSSAGN